MQVIIFPCMEKLTDYVIEKWLVLSEKAIEKNGRFVVALSGGKTPEKLHMALAQKKDLFDWGRTHIFLADERFVPHADPDSNYRMIRETLLDHLGIPKENVHSVPILESGVKASAKKYEESLVEFFSPSINNFPAFDLIILGIGTDGHAASLFPGSPVLNEKNRIACDVVLGKKMHDRITLTLPVINNAKNVIFIAIGENKAGIAKEILKGRNPKLPASLVEPENGELLLLADRDAGSLITTAC